MSYNSELNKTITYDLTGNQILFELQKMVSNMHLKINALSGIASIALKILYIVSIIPIALLQHNILHLSMKIYCLFLYIYSSIYLILSDILLKKLREHFYSYIKKYVRTMLLTQKEILNNEDANIDEMYDVIVIILEAKI